MTPETIVSCCNKALEAAGLSQYGVSFSRYAYRLWHSGKLEQFTSQATHIIAAVEKLTGKAVEVYDGE